MQSNKSSRITALAYLLISICTFQMIPAQTLVNSSFEGQPQEAFVPVGWTPCSSLTTPDIFPGVWGVTLDPAHGDSYMGLITRSDGSNESVGQRAPSILKKDRCYTFSIYIAASDTYAGFNDAVKCRIWLGSKSCQRRQLIFESQPLQNSYWNNQRIKFTPEMESSFIIIEAAFPKPEQNARGNILLDGMSKILPCDRT